MPSAVRTVHPRACGERTVSLRRHQDHCGSSPRLRGTGAQLNRRALAPRFIPAPAGNGVFSELAVTRASVHPRACGERTRASAHEQALAGSSPRLRGTGGYHTAAARAGAVHPRACGERAGGQQLARAVGGSSPRLRGTAPRSGADRTCRRFIPAPAGNGRWRQRARGCRAVHPRACGERPCPLHSR